MEFDNPNSTNPNTDDHQYAPDDDDYFVSISWSKGVLAAAYFKLSSMEMFVTEETFDLKPDFPFLHNIFRTITMRHLIVSGPPEFLRTIIELCGLPANSDLSQYRSTKPNLVSSRFLNIYSNDEKIVLPNRQRILNMDLPGMAPDMSDADRLNYVGTILPIHQTVVLHATGNLLFYLDSNWKFLYLTLAQTTQITSVEVQRLDSMMLMDQATGLALQIFAPTQHHPSGLKKGATRNVREGLSIYSILNRCCSRYGSREMRAMMLQPSRILEELQKRLDCVEWCITKMSTPFMRELCKHLRNIGHISELFVRLVSRGSKPIDWKLMHRTMLSMYKICVSCQQQIELDEENGTPSNKLLCEIACCDDRLVLQKNLCSIYKIMDIGASVQQGSFVVKEGFDPLLQEQKEQMLRIKEQLLKLSQAEVTMFPDYVEQWIVIYLEHFGFLLGVSVPDVMKPHFIRTVESTMTHFKLMYQDTSCMFFQTPKTKLFNDNYGDLHASILSREQHIAERLLNIIRLSVQQAPRISRLCARLDCLVAMAKVSLELQLVRPNVVADKELSIRAGRHIILQLQQSQCTTNDTQLGLQSGKLVTILNAPNSSGKSVYMKQVALIAYLAHIGCFVPAASATVGLLDAVYSRIYSLECTHQSGSSFLNDLQQMAKVMTNSTSNSLILIDEFGKGTNVLEGQAILSACIESLVKRGAAAPITIVSTHFRGVYEQMDNGAIILQQTFACVANGGQGSLRSTYRLMDGVGPAEYAMECDEVSGVLRRMCAQRSSDGSNFAHDDVTKKRIEMILRILKLYVSRPNGLTLQDCIEIRSALS